MKKIYVNKNDEPSLIAEKIIDLNEDEIILTIPRFAKISESLANFHLLKREAEALNKKLVIESVDDKVIELAGISGLDSINPFFAKSRRQFSDIVVPKASSGIDAAKPRRKKLVSEPPAAQRTPKAAHPQRLVIYGLISAAVILGALMLVLKVLPRAEIRILTKKVSWEYKDSVAVDKSLATAELAGALVKVPGQLFSQKKNMSLAFPASGKKQVERKAGGKIIVYNAYSSDPQPLVINTRFETPDGKIFRLTQSIRVAGAKIEDGKIIPSATEATVVADRPGADYNVGPVERFAIPGFKGTPKFAAFYAESKESMADGFVGEMAYPTPEDTKKAKEESAKQLENSLRILLAAQIPEEFKILEGSSRFVIVKTGVGTEVDQAGNFSIFLEGEMSVLTFKEKDLEEALFSRGKKEAGENFVVKNYELNYSGQARLDQAGKMSFPVELTAVFWPNINTEDLKTQVKGKSETDLRAVILALPDVESAKISLWPFWVNKVPENQKKIKVVLE